MTVTMRTYGLHFYFHEADRYSSSDQFEVTVDVPDDAEIPEVVAAIEEAAGKVAADRGCTFVTSPRWANTVQGMPRYFVNVWPDRPSWVSDTPAPAYTPRICMQCGADMNSTRCRHGGPRCDGVHHIVFITRGEYLAATDSGQELEAICGVRRPPVGNPLRLGPCEPCHQLGRCACGGDR